MITERLPSHLNTVRWDSATSVHGPGPSAGTGVKRLEVSPAIGTELSECQVARANDHNSNRGRAGYSSQQNSTRRRKYQSRRDRWYSVPQNRELKNKYRTFLRGYSKFRETCQVSHADIEQAMNKQGGTGGEGAEGFAHYEVTNSSMITARQAEIQEMQRTIELLQDGGVGYLPERKGNGWIRVMFENWNSLGVFTQSWKVDRLKYLVKQLQLDVVMGCEVQCDWSFRDNGSKFLDVLANGQSIKGIAAHNTNERIQREQAGGTAVAGIGRITDLLTASGSDPTGLGRWSWIRLGNQSPSTRIVCGYLPCRPGRNSRGRTVWEQHKRYFESKGDLRYPSTIFMADIVEQLRVWRQAGEEIVLAIDANQDVYDGRLACTLRDSLQMTCLFEPVLGEKVPNSHFRGSSSISTIFGTPGLITNNGMCYPHWYGIGDHRVFVLELSASSLFGGKFPTIATPMARGLNCKISRIRNQYCTSLNRLVHRHRIPEKLKQLEGAGNLLLPTQLQSLHNSLDKELGDYMLSAEKACTKFKSCAIEYSPTVGQWLKRRSVLKWLLRWHAGKVPDTRNLLRAARRSGIDSPLLLTKAEVEARLQACVEQLFALQHQAPELRRKHLQWRLSLARSRDDETTVTEIIRIIKAEARRKRQRAINRVVRPPRGRSVLRVQTTVDEAAVIHDTQQSVESTCCRHLRNRFSLGSHAPISLGKLAEEIGPLGDTDAATRILNATYDFPVGCDQATVDLLRSTARIRLEMEDLAEHTSAITEVDFHGFWDTAKESTSSSKSGRHFGHYKAACSDPELVALHVRNINLAAARGQPLSRWKQGVTVLLEKVAGNIHISKLRAICLLEADFNWWLKVVFAKRMMQRMRAHQVLPPEQGATAGKTTIDSSILKQLFFDQSNILHITSAVSSNDAANCYDAVNHAAGSLALQAMRVPLPMVQCYLRCIQTMQFFLKTGFGMATQSYGGTASRPFMGLTQGSGASPAAWCAISTVIVHAYKSKGFGAGFYSAWSRAYQSLAALLYVDDTDLLHMSKCADEKVADFVERVQEATYYWAKLLQATGGDLKPSKCYWYLLTYHFSKGQAKLGTAGEMPSLELRIPQTGGEDVPIALKGPNEASEVLGVWSSPSGTDGRHLQYMMEKGYKWSRCVTASSLSSAEVWHSFKTQALPSVTYGLVPMMASRADVDDAFQKWYFSFLPSLGVNRNIAKEWRTLPNEFQGLGLPQMSLEKLASSLQYLLRHWGTSTQYGIALRSIFELIQLETGLEGNFLLRSYQKYHILASHSWFKVLWEYLDYYKVHLDLGSMAVPLVRERDRVFMEEAVTVLPRNQWASINRTRHYFKVYFLSQLVLCDGTTVDPTKLCLLKQAQSTMKFPRQQPTQQDLDLWKHTIALITSPTYRLSPRLGTFLRLPYDEVYWKTTANRTALVQHSPDSDPILYTPVARLHNTRGRCTYEYSASDLPEDCYSYIASVSPSSNRPGVTVHSQARLLHQKGKKDWSLRESLATFGHPEVWHTLEIEGDERWIVDAYRLGSLVLCHDGSYMPQQDVTCCSAAVVIICTRTAKQAHVTFCERTDSGTASNYRGELIGGVLSTTLLRALAKCTSSQVRHCVTLHCDNMGVVCHGNNFLRSLPEKQAQQDVLHIFRRNLVSLPHPVRYQHVYGHLDDGAMFTSLSLPQQLNVMADALAKESLQHSILCMAGSRPLYPLEPIRIFIGGHKVTSSIKGALYRHWGKQQAIRLFEKKKIVSRYIFPQIYWEGLWKSMIDFPQMYRTWVTKHVSGFCGVNRLLSRIDPTVENVCPCCLRPDESVAHLTRCQDPGRRKAFRHSVTALLSWMGKTYMDPNMISCLSIYLESIGEGSMTDIAKPFPYLSSWATEHDTIGWDNFLEGKVGRHLIEHQRAQLAAHSPRVHIQTWATKLVQHLLGIVHHQWVYRNTKLHLRLVEGKTAAEHDEVMHQVLRLLATDVDDMLPQYRYLLDSDMGKLGRGPTTDRQYWVANMSSALAASRCLTVPPFQAMQAIHPPQRRSMVSVSAEDPP